jgi:CheY-like chemotaxis protein
VSHPESARRVIDVLLVEDDAGDALMIREAFQHHDIRHTLHHVVDGVDAMRFLRNEDEYGDCPRPDLILLDLNLPRMDGRQVLREVKGDPELRTIPIVVLTTSDADEDIVRSYELHANAYVTKPVDFDNFVEAVRQTDEFFLKIVKLPRRA